ncbi:hypothetical protein K461DRAFT_169062 [Myriangium duriaei CBS 260.36]|uniref:Uncharacterized protein n=1 Tax=Myriangium duriaei CBS 260.36 TaxID=1168546 RepID=A0A9P4MKY0_9PEZI|nr:hypothetical protein K461DRAFT_169062 [Myriangium duriaei CBS 260.36]
MAMMTSLTPDFIGHPLPRNFHTHHSRMRTVKPKHHRDRLLWTLPFSVPGSKRKIVGQTVFGADHIMNSYSTKHSRICSSPRIMQSIDSPNATYVEQLITTRLSRRRHRPRRKSVGLRTPHVMRLTCPSVFDTPGMLDASLQSIPHKVDVHDKAARARHTTYAVRRRGGQAVMLLSIQFLKQLYLLSLAPKVNHYCLS